MPGPDDDVPEPLVDEVDSLDETNRVPVSHPDQQTRAYKSAEFLAGRDAGFKEGVDAAVAALSAELVRARATADEIKHIVARVRAGSVSRG
ncbi:MAG TPA: hypothetical protein VHO67_05245 [Polyangia bacterium]|nr:hypothetical protein [Polyangia bacterium]